MRFWDASALVPLLVTEPATDAMAGVLREDAQIVTWWGSRVECASALARLGREADGLSPGARERLEVLWRGVLEVEPTDHVRSTALRLLDIHSLRAADALQLAAALEWCEGEPRGAGFVSLDERLSAAARAQGFEMLPGH